MDDDPGVGYLFAISSRRPFDFDDITRGDYWDYRLIDGGRIQGDPYVRAHRPRRADHARAATTTTTSSPTTWTDGTTTPGSSATTATRTPATTSGTPIAGPAPDSGWSSTTIRATTPTATARPERGDRAPIAPGRASCSATPTPRSRIRDPRDHRRWRRVSVSPVRRAHQPGRRGTRGGAGSRRVLRPAGSSDGPAAAGHTGATRGARERCAGYPQTPDQVRPPREAADRQASRSRSARGAHRAPGSPSCGGGSPDRRMMRPSLSYCWSRWSAGRPRPGAQAPRRGGETITPADIARPDRDASRTTRCWAATRRARASSGRRLRHRGVPTAGTSPRGRQRHLSSSATARRGGRWTRPPRRWRFPPGSQGRGRPSVVTCGVIGGEVSGKPISGQAIAGGRSARPRGGAAIRGCGTGSCCWLVDFAGRCRSTSATGWTRSPPRARAVVILSNRDSASFSRRHRRPRSSPGSPPTTAMRKPRRPSWRCGRGRWVRVAARRRARPRPASRARQRGRRDLPDLRVDLRLARRTFSARPAPTWSPSWRAATRRSAPEYVAISAHLDHVGVRTGRPATASTTARTTTPPGVAGLLELAEAFAGREARPGALAAVPGAERRGEGPLGQRPLGRATRRCRWPTSWRTSTWT